MARSCRLRHCSKVVSYLGYTDRDRSLIGAAAPDPLRKQPGPAANGRSPPYFRAAFCMSFGPG
jgi:hypothetical protein